MVRFVDSGDGDGGESHDGLAPVTPLFGERAAPAFPQTPDEVRRVMADRFPGSVQAADATVQAPAEPAARVPAADSRTGWGERGVGEGDQPGAAPIDLSAKRAGRTESRRSRPGNPSGRPADDDAAEAAERGLLRKLRARQLSVSEAKAYLAQHDLDTDAVERILAEFVDRGYLDDARLAEQVVYAGVDRKGQGRQAIGQSLAKRGVPRDIADAALAGLPDDDAERALEYARTKAASLRNLERDVALRRLAGQLTRRGYGGSVALTAARTALDESSRPSSRVRFE